jgi:dTMP kinase
MSCFITLEGPEGGGKSSQARLLSKGLQADGHDVLFTREPGGSPIGDQIRQVLMSLDNTSMHPTTEFLLFSASRAQHVRQVIRPHLEADGVVVSDRYFHSSLAYQGYGHGLDLDILWEITQFATDGLQPDLILLLDLPVEAGLRRKRSKGEWNRLDAYEKEFHERVRQGYLKMASEDPGRWAIVDASPPIEIVQNQIRKLALACLHHNNMLAS